MPKLTNEKRIQSLEESTSELNDKIDKLIDIVSEQVKSPEPEQEEPRAEEPEVDAFPVPPAFRGVVDEVLNDQFGVQITQMDDSPAFQLNIVVPEKYSSLKGEQLKMAGADIRSKVVSHADGVNGVREWANRVFESFNPDMKAMILADKVNQHATV